MAPKITCDYRSDYFISIDGKHQTVWCREHTVIVTNILIILGLSFSCEPNKLPNIDRLYCEFSMNDSLIAKG